MNILLGIGEWISGVFLNLLSIPMMVLGLFTGMRGGARYFNIKEM